jgi:hypothetical protein
MTVLVLMVLGASAWGFELGAGLTASYGLSFTNDFVPGSIDYNGTQSHLLLSGFFDFFYGRLSLMYVTNLGNPVSTPPFTGGSMWLTQIGASLIAKLPVVTKPVTLWSGAGIGFLYTLMLDLNGDGINGKASTAQLDDFYLLMAFGADFKLFGIITIGPVFTLNYNLTPAAAAIEPAGSTHTQVVLQFSVAVGIAF